MTYELPSPDSHSSDDDAILQALERELELNPYDELDWLAGSIYRGAHQLETLQIHPDLTITEGRDIPFGHLGQDKLNGELFREASGSYRGSISVVSDDRLRLWYDYRETPSSANGLALS